MEDDTDDVAKDGTMYFATLSEMELPEGLSELPIVILLDTPPYCSAWACSSSCFRRCITGRLLIDEGLGGIEAFDCVP